MQGRPLSEKRKKGFCLLCLIIIIGVFFVGAEIWARRKGVQPFHKNSLGITVQPGGKFFKKHPTLGYRHLPGEFKITLPSGYLFHVTHSKDTLRITHPKSSFRSPNHGKDGIWIFGGSFTYGWALNDNETYPWIIKEAFPDHEVVNFGVNGYGTLHALIQFQEALKHRRPLPRIAIIAYAYFHDERNTFLRFRRKTVYQYNYLGPLVQPYAKINKVGELVYSMAKVDYFEFPLMRYSSFIHFLEQQYNLIEARLYNSHEVTKAIVKEFFRIAKKHSIQLVIVGIAGHHMTNAILAYAKRLGILTEDISVDLENRKNNNLPHDSHPSAHANIQYAQKLNRILENIMKKKRLSRFLFSRHLLFVKFEPIIQCEIALFNF